MVVRHSLWRQVCSREHPAPTHPQGMSVQDMDERPMGTGSEMVIGMGMETMTRWYP